MLVEPPLRLGARNLMVIGQMALSLALLAAGGTFAPTALQAASKTPGYDYDALLVASLDTTLARFDDGRRRAAYAGILERLRSTASVERVSVTSTLPFGDAIDCATLEPVGDAGGGPVRARAYRIIGADYFATLGLRMVRGREFTPAEERSPAAPRVAIVDEAFARQVFAERNPIGKLIRLAPSPDDAASSPGEPMEIVGVAAPLREELLDRAPVPHAYVPFGREERALMHVLVRVAPGRDAAAALEDVRLALRAAEPGLPVLTLSTLQAFHDRSPELRALGLGARVFAGLAGVAVLIAAIGDGALLAGAGVTIGVPLAILVSVALRSVFVEVGGFDAVVVGVSTAILVSAAAIAALVPARRATRVQPLTALRGE